MTRSIMKAKLMPKEFWAKAVSCVVYLSNQSPMTNVKDQTPQEAWSKRQPSVAYLRIFKSVAYAHMPQQERSKLDDRSVKHVFIGYDQNSKGYKLYNPSNGKIMVSQDVEFDEEAIWDWETNEESTYDFLPYFEEDITTPIQDTTPPPPITPPHSPSSSSQDEDSSEKSQKMRSLSDIYDKTEEITANELFCLFVDSEPLNFDDAVKDKKWSQAMEEEINAIEKNDT